MVTLQPGSDESKSVNVYQHSVNHILVLKSSAQYHQAQARKFTESVATMINILRRRSPGRSVSNVQSNSITGICSWSSSCRLCCPTRLLARTQISHHASCGQCLTSCCVRSCCVSGVLQVVSIRLSRDASLFELSVAGLPECL